MASQKAHKKTKEIIEPVNQNQYQSDELTDSFKGRVAILKPEESEIAKNLKINKKGTYAAKLG